MEKRLSNRAYWQTVTSRALSRVWDSSAIKGIILALGVLVLATVGFGILLSNGIITLSSFRDSIISTSVFQIATVCLYGIIVVGIFGSYLLRLPVERHNEQIDEINALDNQVKELKDKYEGDQVQANLVIFPFPHHLSNDFWRVVGAGIRIENRGSVPITNPSVELDTLVWLIEGNGNTRMPIVISEANRIFPSWIYPNQQNVISPHGHARVQIVEIRNDKVWFLLRDNYCEPRTESVQVPMGYEERARYEISLWIRGEIGGRAIHARKFVFPVRFVRVMSKSVFDHGWREVSDYQIYTSFLEIGPEIT